MPQGRQKARQGAFADLVAAKGAGRAESRLAGRYSLLLSALAVMSAPLVGVLAFAGLDRASAFVPAGERFTCSAVAVWDGDGPIWCASGPKLRIAGIAARELDGSCRPGHPCPKASGIAARDALVRLLGGPRGVNRTKHILIDPVMLTCRSAGDGMRDRTAASCALPDGRDLASAMVSTGTVLRWDFKGK